jgi:hypothetical protein
MSGRVPVAGWLVAAAWISLAFAAVPATVVAAYIASGRRQRMWIMNVVWPVTVLYAGPLVGISRPGSAARRPVAGAASRRVARGCEGAVVVAPTEWWETSLAEHRGGHDALRHWLRPGRSVRRVARVRGADHAVRARHLRELGGGLCLGNAWLLRRGIKEPM